MSLTGGNVLTVQGNGFPSDDLSATTVNVVIYDHRFGSNITLTVPCSILSVAANGQSLQCVLSRPDYEHTPYFNILLYGVPDTASNPTGRRLLATSAGISAMTEDIPTVQPTCQPSNQPTIEPTMQPSAQPSSDPSRYFP